MKPASMKVSLVLSAIILAIGLTIGCIYQNKLRELRVDRDQLVARAVTLGITTEPGLAKHDRDEREPRTRSAAAAESGDFARHLQIPLENDECAGLLSGAASSDPALAFTRIADLGVEEISEAVHAIIGTAKTPGQRAAVLEAFRGYLAGIPDEAERDKIRAEALGEMACNLGAEGFDPLTAWLTSQKLDPAELSSFAAGLSYETIGGETGRWIDWMAASVPTDQRGERISDLMGQWTQEDYVTAGEWLAAAAEGPARTAAVKAYAEGVAEYEPQIAAQWVLTLADPEDRAETLKRIYLNLPAAEAAAFAAEHGVERD